MNARCGHGRERRVCWLCAMKINPADYWFAVKLLNARRRDRAKRAGQVAR